MGISLCIYLHEYSYAYIRRPEMKNVSHIEYMNTHFLQCVSYCAYSNFFDICTVCDTLYTNTALSCQDVDALSLSKPSVDAIPNRSRDNGSPNNLVQLSRTRREEVTNFRAIIDFFKACLKTI